MTSPVPYAEVIGDPIAHSKSPLIHGHWLAAAGIGADYRACHVRADGLSAYVADRAADPAWRGCNVTLPHKQAVVDLVADPGGVRASIGAMNIIFRSETGALVGTNSDAAGFYAPLAEVELGGSDVIVIGAGGAARAVLFALARAKPAQVTIYNRSPLKAAALLSHFSLSGRALPLAADLAVPPADLLVNASSLGMAGGTPLAIDLARLPAEAIVYDLVYAPVDTPLMLAARAQGLATIDGLDMLIGQAAVAFELFYGRPPPGDDAALRQLLLTGA